VTVDRPVLGMLLKGYPRISESFISSEILLLEQLGIPLEIYSLRQPRETFTHRSVHRIRAAVTYLPEYVLPHPITLLASNARLAVRLRGRYLTCLAAALVRAARLHGTATVRHFLQAAHLAQGRLVDRNIGHLHAHFCHTPTSVALFAHQLTGIPFSFTAHAKDIYTSEPEQLRRKLEAAAFVVTCTRYNARYLSRLNPTATPIHVIYHGIDPDFFAFEPAPPPQAPFRILSIGRLVAKKGYDDLLMALKMLGDAGLDFRFNHIGSGDQQEAVGRLVGKLGLGERVRFLGTLPHHEVLGHYRRSHCFVLACKIAPNGDQDGIPNVLIEAMAAGVPVLSTRVSAIPELIEHGVTGTLVDPADPPALARALAAILTRPAAYRALLESARARVERSFDNRRCITKLRQLFQQALAAAPASRGRRP